MAITQAMCTSFKVEILNGIHAFGTSVIRAATTADTFKIALYTSSASLDATTTAYSTSNEVTTGTGYTAGGNTLSSTTPSSYPPTSSGTTAYLGFNNTTWSTASFTARGALIYNSSQSNKAVAVLDFGGDKTASAGDFTIQFPSYTSTTAIIRIA
jgi:hypothetical protein